MTEPLPRNIDYQGNERLPAYVRGVTHKRCGRCKGSGTDPVAANHCGYIIGTLIPICRQCGGYGCVPATSQAATVNATTAAEA